MRNTNKQSKLIEAIRTSKGRFFGLYTTNRPAINAQFQSETPAYVMIYDRNSRVNRKLAKSSIIGVHIAGQTLGEAY
jgi:hypothetical protein